MRFRSLCAVCLLLVAIQPAAGESQLFTSTVSVTREPQPELNASSSILIEYISHMGEDGLNFVRYLIVVGTGEQLGLTDCGRWVDHVHLQRFGEDAQIFITQCSTQEDADRLFAAQFGKFLKRTYDPEGAGVIASFTQTTSQRVSDLENQYKVLEESLVKRMDALPMEIILDDAAYDQLVQRLRKDLTIPPRP